MRNVVLLGKGELAIRVATWFHDSDDHNLIAVVPVTPEPGWTESLRQWCKQNGVAEVASGNYRELRTVIGDKPIDLAFSVFYDKILKAPFISECGRCLNLHNGPLPRYRGVSPINWALKNNELSHGTTIHEITPGVDDGPVVAQVTYSIFPETDEVEDVYRRSLKFGWTLFEQTIEHLDKIEPRAQDDALASHYTKQHDHLLGERRGFRRP